MMHVPVGPRYYINPNFAIGAAPLEERTQKMTSWSQMIPAYKNTINNMNMNAVTASTLDENGNEEVASGPTKKLNGSMVERLKQVVADAGQRVQQANKRGHQYRMMVDCRQD